MSKQVETKTCDKCGKEYPIYRVKMPNVPYSVHSLICKECAKAQPDVIMGKVVILDKIRRQKQNGRQEA